MITGDRKLNGLVLSGGKSTRMGSDKGSIAYHNNVPHREYLYKLLQNLCDNVFMSLREDQKEDISGNFNVIEDKNIYRGPFNGLFSAHHHNKDAAWLVLACDLPLMNLEALKQLASCRNPEKLATAFASKENKLPEPLCAIWEPRAFQDAREYLNGESSCPRKFLINSATELVFPEDEKVLLNANYEEDYKQVMQQLADAL
jgi:molybdopterin-guanine dinucleotide biosynthesis protein A